MLYNASTSALERPVAWAIFSMDKPNCRRFFAVSTFACREPRISPSASPRDLPSASPCATPAFHPSFRASRSSVFTNIYSLPFANTRSSALSLHKKQSSTYNKYACGCFLHAPSICSVYLQKALQYRQGWRWFHAVATFCRTAKLVFSDRHGCLSENDISMS